MKGAISETTVSESHQILKAIVIQGYTPIIFFIPVFVSALYMSLGLYTVEDHLLVNWTINMLKCNSALDGFLTLLVIKPYREDFVKMFAFFNKIKPV